MSLSDFSASALMASLGAEEAARARRALDLWVQRGRDSDLLRWLGRALDERGVPRDWPVTGWIEVLHALDLARRARPGGWPEEADVQVEGLFRATLRFSRPDGHPVFERADDREDLSPGPLLRAWAARLSDPTLAAVVGRWFPKARQRESGIPPLPAFALDDRALAVLRPDWTNDGDLLAIDQRESRADAFVELRGRGRTWLGSSWTNTHGEPSGPIRPTRWKTGPMADLFEWSYRANSARVTRVVALLRGRSAALIAEIHEGRGIEGPAEFRLALPPGIVAKPMAGLSGLILKSSRGPSAQVIPIGLPPGFAGAETGKLVVEDSWLVLRQTIRGPRDWLPLLISWNPTRHRRETTWRRLTVSDKSTIRGPEIAFGARVAWGRDESLLIYRSLARPVSRCLLGHQTKPSTRFLVSAFDREGDVSPILEDQGAET